MISCKDVNRSLAANENQGVYQRLAIFMHHLICVKCRKYASQLKGLGHQARYNYVTFKKVHKEELATLKNKIKKKL